MLPQPPQLLRAGLLPEAYIAPRELPDVRELLRHRVTLVAMRSAIKNRVHAILARHGVIHQHADLFGKAGRQFLATVELRPAPRQRIDSLLALVENFDREIDAAGNPAYRGQAAFGKTKTAERPGGPTRITRQRGERHGRRLTGTDQPAEKWTLIPVPPLVTEETFALAQARLVENAHFSKRNTKQLTLLQGVLVCRECGYACYRTSTRTSNKRISYYRCIGQDGWRHPDGKRCTSGPVRADELDPLVWAEVRRLLENPELVRAEIERRLAAVRTEHPAAQRREALERDITRANSALERLIEAYQEQLISLEELRARTPALRKRQSTLQAQLDRLDAELHDAETYLQLADTLEGFLDRLADGLDQLDIAEQQRILRLVVREVLIGGDDDKITIRHSIPTPNGGPNDPSYLLRGSSPLTAARERRPVGP